uniref:Uncharacterized protein n=1 Tax=Alexandrium monilatum TaxID=311494 RepID=A0A7S4QIM8_9DINO
MPRDTKELQWFRHGGGDEIHSGTQLIGYIEAMFNYLEDEGGERRIIREKSSGPSDFGKRDFRAAVLELIGSAGEMPVRDGNFGKLLRGGSITYETVLYTCTVLISMHAPEDFGTVGRGHLAILSTPFKDGGFEASCGLAMDIAAAGYMPWSPNPMSMMKLLRDGFHRMSQPGYQCPPGSVVKGVELVFKQVMCDEFWLNLFSWSLQYFNVMTGSSIFFQCLDSANEGRLGGPGQRFEAAMIKSINQLRGIPGCCPPGFANKDLTVVKVVSDRVGGGASSPCGPWGGPWPGSASPSPSSRRCTRRNTWRSCLRPRRATTSRPSTSRRARRRSRTSPWPSSSVQ